MGGVNFFQSMYSESLRSGQQKPSTYTNWEVNILKRLSVISKFHIMLAQKFWRACKDKQTERRERGTSSHCYRIQLNKMGSSEWHDNSSSF